MKLYIYVLTITFCLTLACVQDPKDAQDTRNDPIGVISSRGFFARCSIKSDLDIDERKTVDELLEISGENNCEKAEAFLKTKTELTLSKAKSILPLSIFSNLKKLTLMQADSGYMALLELRNLETLVIWSQTVEDKELEVLPRIHSLENLTIENTYKLTQASLKSIGACKKLKRLAVISVPYTSFMDLENLELLEYLEIWSAKIESFDFVRNFKNLEELYTNVELKTSKNSQFTHLQNLKKFRAHGEAALEVLSTLPNKSSVRHLDLYGLKNLDGIEQFINLETLQSYFGKIRDLSPLKNLLKLQKLNLSWNEINGDISALKDLVNLLELSLSSSNVEDLSPLLNLKKLETLSLSENKIKDVRVFKSGGFNSLREILLSGNPFLYDLSPLGELTTLEEVWIDKVKPLSFDFLKKLNPQKVFIDDSGLNNLTYFSHMTNLSFLRVSGNLDIKDLLPVAHLEKLTTLIWLKKDQIETGKCPENAASIAVKRICNSEEQQLF